MGNYSLKNISPLGETDLSKGVFIILFNVTNIPPHLLLSVDGKIYSITDSGRQMGSSLDKLLLFIKRKSVPTIFLEWAELKGWKVERLKSLIQDTFAEYDRVVEGKVSCLFPIRDVVAEVLGEQMRKADFIFELLPLMEKENATGKVLEVNMGNAVVNGEFELLTYTEEELKNELARVK